MCIAHVTFHFQLLFLFPVLFIFLAFHPVLQAAAMCGVPVNAAPDMTGLGGKARMVTSTITDNSVDDSKSSGEGKEAVKPAENLLLEVRYLFYMVLGYYCS